MSQNLTGSVYMPWQKLGVSSNDELFQDFVQKCGPVAGQVLQALQVRHQPMNFSSYPTEPSSFTWEDTWSAEQSETRDPEGTALVKKLAEELKKKNMKFTDPLFPANATSLYVDASQKFQDFLEGHHTSNIAWKRPSEIYADKFKVFSGTISPNDVKQGLLGNCWFLAAVAAVATNKDDVLVNDLIIENYADQGMYGVKFYLMGRWVTVVIDDLLPVSEAVVSSPLFPIYRRGTLLFCRPGENSENKDGFVDLWPLLLEKALAKLFGSYESQARS